MNQSLKAATISLGVLLALGACGAEPADGGKGGDQGTGGELGGGGGQGTPEIAACQAVQLDTGSIVWRNVRAGEQVERALILANPDAEACSIALEVEGSAFFVDEEQLVLPANGWAQIRVGYAAGDVGPAEGMLLVHGAERLASIALRGEVRAAGCLSLFPEELRFGIVTPSCGQATIDVRLRNECDHPTTLEDLELLPVEGASEAPFELVEALVLPREMAAGDELKVPLAWRSDVDGDEVLFAIREDGHSYELSLRAVGLDAPGTTTFRQAQVGEAQAARFLLDQPARDLDGDGGFEDDIDVAIDGMPLPSILEGELVWWYVQDEPAIEFAPAHVPTAGSLVDVTYVVDCRAR